MTEIVWRSGDDLVDEAEIERVQAYFRQRFPEDFEPVSKITFPRVWFQKLIGKERQHPQHDVAMNLDAPSHAHVA